MKKIAIIGGHATPAIAVLNELKKFDAYRFVWIGEKYNQRGSKNPSQEFQTITEEYKIPFINLRSGKLNRYWRLQTFFKNTKDLFLLVNGLFSSFFILLKERPSVIVSFGGFLAVPVAINAWFMRIPILTHEQTVTTGLANKIIAKFASVVAYSWNNPENFKSEKYKHTGNPIRASVFDIRNDIASTFKDDLPLIYITGGNQGAHIINKTVWPVLSELLDKFNIIHQTGNSSITNDYQHTLEVKADLKPQLRTRYLVKDYVSEDEIGSVFKNATLFVSRSGANTITELMAHGIMSILIPIPWSSQNEQYRNAKKVESLGLCKIIEEESLQPQKLIQEIQELTLLIDKGEDTKGRNIELAKSAAYEVINMRAARDIAQLTRGLIE